jgi:lipopolysaccharide heptosyltransferase I
VKKTVLVVKFSALGDVVHALPAVQIIRDKHPKAKIIWVIKGNLSPLLKHLPFVDEVVTLDPGSKGFRDALSKVRSFSPSIAFDLQGLIKSGLFTLLSGAKERVGWVSQQARESLSSCFLNRRVKPDASLHIVEQLAMIVSATPASDIPPFNLVITSQERGAAASINSSLGIGGPYLVFLPGAGWPTKMWPVENYSWLADKATGHYDISVLLLWGPGEEKLVTSFKEESHVKIAPPTNLREMMAILQGATLVVGGDTGPLHVAAALETPTLGLYGPSHAWRNGPYGNRHLVVEVACDRKGCYKRRCRKQCVASIPREMVWDALQVMLEEEMNRK